MDFEQTPDFTLFHSRLWIETLLTAFPQWRDTSEVVVLPDGRRALLPLLETDRALAWRWLEAMPFGFLGGPLVTEGALSREDMGFLLSHFRHRAGWLALNLDPCDSLARAEQLPLGATPLTTHLLTLQADFEVIERGFSSMVRRHVRAAEREGVTVRRGVGLADFRGYYGLTQHAARQWGLDKAPFPPPLYEALAALPGEKVSLWLAAYREQVIGGLISLHYRPERVMYWGGAVVEAYNHLNPAKLLQRAAIQEACARGAAVYNLGPSVGFDGALLEGVRQAKEALGARPFEYHIPIVMNGWAMRARSLRNRFYERTRR